MPNEQCEICGGTGKIPFKNKEGKIVPYTWEYCPTCYDTNYDDHTRALEPEDVDFTLSYSVWRSLCQLHGWHDPGPDYPPEPEPPQEQVIVPRPIVNVTYKVKDVDTPAFKSLQEQISLINGRLTKYFEPKEKPDLYK